MDDALFLQAILEQPDDDRRRLAYADWLDEQANEAAAGRAQFLRATVKIPACSPENWPPEQLAELRELAAGLDTEWLAAVSRLPVEFCSRHSDGLSSPPGIAFTFLCDRQWDQLVPMVRGNERYCSGCQRTVFYCDSVEEALRHAASNHCIALSLATPRGPNALPEQMMWVGEADESDPPALTHEQRQKQIDAFQRQSRIL